MGVPSPSQMAAFICENSCQRRCTQTWSPSPTPPGFSCDLRHCDLHARILLDTLFPEGQVQALPLVQALPNFEPHPQEPELTLPKLPTLVTPARHLTAAALPVFACMYPFFLTHLVLLDFRDQAVPSCSDGLWLYR